MHMLYSSHLVHESLLFLLHTALLVSGLKISEAMMLLFAPEPTMAMDAVKFRSIMSSIAIIDDAHTSVACVLSEKLKLEVLDPIAVNLDAINDLKGDIAALSGAYIDHSEFTEKIKKLRRNRYLISYE